jgi:hypothetical protein
MQAVTFKHNSLDLSERAPIAIEEEDGRAPGPVWTFKKREKYFVYVEN